MALALDRSARMYLALAFVQELDTVLPMFFDRQVGLSGWRRSFDVAGEDCFDLAGKLVPAFTTSSLPSDG
jgi:hypothetical protein